MAPPRHGWENINSLGGFGQGRVGCGLVAGSTSPYFGLVAALLRLSCFLLDSFLVFFLIILLASF